MVLMTDSRSLRGASGSRAISVRMNTTSSGVQFAFRNADASWSTEKNECRYEAASCGSARLVTSHAGCGTALRGQEVSDRCLVVHRFVLRNGAVGNLLRCHSAKCLRCIVPQCVRNATPALGELRTGGECMRGSRTGLAAGLNAPPADTLPPWTHTRKDGDQLERG